MSPFNVNIAPCCMIAELVSTGWAKALRYLAAVTTMSPAHLDAMVEQATVDCHDEAGPGRRPVHDDRGQPRDSIRAMRPAGIFQVSSTHTAIHATEM
jgi:hypothetical protein